MNAIVAKLKDKKKALGLSNKELSTMSGVPYSTVCRVLANKADGTPNLQTLKDLAKALDVSIDGAMGLDEEPVSEENIAEEEISETSTPAPSESKVDPSIITLMANNYNTLLEERQKLLDAKDQALKSMDKWLHRLFIVCCVLVAVIVGILIFDLVNPSVGFFQR